MGIEQEQRELAKLVERTFGIRLTPTEERGMAPPLRGNTSPNVKKNPRPEWQIRADGGRRVVALDLGAKGVTLGRNGDKLRI